MISHYQVNMRRWPNVGLLLGHRRRRWANSEPTVGQRLMFTGYKFDYSLTNDANDTCQQSISYNTYKVWNSTTPYMSLNDEFYSTFSIITII